MKFTKEEISLCKQVAEKHRKEIEYADWYWSASYNEPLLATDGGFKTNEQEHHGVFKIWTISDCLEFLREKDIDLTLNYFTHVGWWQVQLWNESSTQAFYSDFNKENKNKTPLEACLKAVLAVLEEK